MSYIKTTFLGAEYTIPADILLYIDLLDFTSSIKTRLTNTFVQKLKGELQKGNVACVSDEDLAPEIERQVGLFIAKLTENNIYDRTVNDYLRQNEGYKLISKVNAAALEEARRALKQQMSDWLEGYEDAVQKKESSVTGLGFSIWSSSFVNHAIYAAMEASKVHEQAKAAAKAYQRDMEELDDRLENRKNEQEKQYVANTYIPNMETAITIFSYELLDTFISDLIKYGKLNKEVLNYIHIDRSNDLLKNLELSQNKPAVLLKAFEACPYNIAVYMQAMKHDLLGYASFQTAKIFGHGNTIISFLEKNLGGSAKSEKKRLNFKNAELLSLYSGRPLREITAYMADFIVDGYAQIVAALTHTTPCYNIMNKVDEEDILAGNSISKEKAKWLVDPLAPAGLWDKLTIEYGHTDLLDRLLALLPAETGIQSKKEYDFFLKKKLFAVLETIRQERVAEILKRRKSEEREREAEAEQARIADKKRRKVIKYSVIIGIVSVILIVVFSLVSSYVGTISKIDDYIAIQQYEHAFDAANRSNLSDEKKQEYINGLVPLMQKQIVNDLEKNQIINADNYGIFLEDNEIIVCDANGNDLLHYEGHGKILEEIIYSNGYFLFVEAFDNWGYDVNYFDIENGRKNTIETFDEFDRLVKLKDGRILIEPMSSDDLAVIFDPYTRATETSADFSVTVNSIGIVYDTNNYGFVLEEGEGFSSIDFSNCDVGDIIQFGRYEQDGRTANGKESVDWLILEIKDRKALVISKYAIEVRSYNNGDKYSQDVRWDECSLREWLNEDFLTSTFNQSEISIISAAERPDRMFLLDVDMAKQYFLSDSDRQCQVTSYAETKGASTIDGNCWWWLESHEDNAMAVGYEGDICEYGHYLHIGEDEYAVRPAMWIDISNVE